MNTTQIILPPEWALQSAVLLTWPHEKTDWADMLEEVEGCFVQITEAISRYEKVLIVCPDQNKLRQKLVHCNHKNILFQEISSDDTWARDHGAITVIQDDNLTLYDFSFNGWGKKFSANQDNEITAKLFKNGVFANDVKYIDYLDFILEGGSIESDGEGTLLTTSACLMSKNRNEHLSKSNIENQLKSIFGLKQILWLDHGYLAGDDTDSHIDTLARFCNAETIAYVKCDHPNDEHFEQLSLMEAELKAFRTLDQKPYRLLALPMADEVYDQGDRLPATYANFLIINDAVLVPFYDSPKDKQAAEILKLAFPDREIIGIDCRPLIKQHGSLHCVTMQFPIGIIKDDI